MHAERLSVTFDTIRSLAKATKRIAVGTTTLRCLESLYWYGAKLHQNPDSEFIIKKDDPYFFENKSNLPTLSEALNVILDRMTQNRINSIQGTSQLFIVPGYTFRVINGLITNFHMPKSTLLLLIAALVGDNWRDIYKEAMSSRYRFLSYGDASFLIA